MMLSFLSAVLFSTVVYANTANLLSVLSAQPSLTKFTSLINANPDLLAAAQAGDMTIIAPNDDAFSTFSATPTSAGNYSSPDQLNALIQYHILKGTHASYSITTTPSFLPSILTNSTYTNVTTGQVVEAIANQTELTFRSSVHQVSNIVGPAYDIVFVGGLIHIVDAVMIPPINALATVTDYPLQYFIQSLSVVLNNDFLPVVEGLVDTPNQTYFIANSPVSANSVAHNNDTGSYSYILGFVKYSVVPGGIYYSTDLTNGTQLATEAGVDVTITELDGYLYVNDCKIIVNDILIANGVIHVIDKYLNSSDPGARPQINSTNTSSTNTTTSTKDTTKSGAGLSTGAKAGIGVGVALLVIGVLASVVMCILRKRRSPNQVYTHPSQNTPEVGNNYIYEKDNHKLPSEMITKSYDAVELPSRSGPHELEGKWNQSDMGSRTADEHSRSAT